ncbi:hypothetical protein BJY24_007570 [Nocardia transvalensis]|uniref:Uncharacterized protein n=1 Tax=Nocardia transvalensis TaxID=37333 RepID=A0A7W9PN31_9NOCA|nr:hypothetical protein [Nocardia transvalensis]MBB5918658.1 hypothetical protein [Nocardia transvalensis]
MPAVAQSASSAPAASRQLAFDSELTMPETPRSIPESNDRLVRHLFDIGLQLHSVRAVFDRELSTPEELQAARATMVEVLDDLDTLIRDAGNTTLDLALQHGPETPADRPRRRRRR